MLGRIDTAPNRLATELFDGLPARYDRLGALLSLGQDRRWRKEMVRHVRAAPTGRVLDVATGPAGVALAIRSATGAQVGGLDLTGPMLERARQNHLPPNLHGVPLIRGGARSSRSPTEPSTLSPSPTSCATWPTRRPPSPSWPGWCGPAASWPASSSTSHRPPGGVVCGGGTPVWCCRWPGG